jgi:hypothetical protein
VFPGWSVRATGAFAYQETDPAIMDIDGTLAAVDATSSSIDISTVSGTMHVALDPVEPAWLTRLPVGGAVRAHFDHGLVLTESADGSLLLALLEGQGNISSASFDVGPVHVSGDGRPRCIALTQADTSCTVGGTHTDSTFALGAVTATLRAGEPPVPLSDGARAFEVALLGSLRQSSNDELRGIGFGLPCAPALATGTVVRIGLGAP